MKVEDSISLSEKMLKSQAEKIWVELRNGVTLEGGYAGNRMITDVAYARGSDFASVKITPQFPKNTATREVPINPGVILLFDGKNGRPLMVAGAKVFTAYATSALTAVGAKYLARRNGSILAIIGAGVEGRSHILALDKVVKLSRVKVYDIRKEQTSALLSDVSKSITAQMVASDSVHEAVKGADIIVTVTTANEPLIKASWLKPGIFLAKIGSYQELELEVLLQSDKLVVDNWDYVSVRANEIQALMKRGTLSKNSVYAELPEIVAGKVKGRENDEEKILFIALGTAAKYGQTAPYVYKRALEYGVGKVLPQIW